MIVTLAGKTAIVTGAASGIGLAVAQKYLDANADGVIAVDPVMIRQRSGVILNTGSISGEAGIATQGAYGPSKGAIHQMTRQMAI